MTTTSAAADSAKREVALWLARHPFSVGAPKAPVRRVQNNNNNKKKTLHNDDDDDDDDDDAHGGDGKRKIKALDAIELKSQVRSGEHGKRNAFCEGLTHSLTHALWRKVANDFQLVFSVTVNGISNAVTLLCSDAWLPLFVSTDSVRHFHIAVALSREHAI
jgi:hypothetical protein